MKKITLILSILVWVLACNKSFGENHEKLIIDDFTSTETNSIGGNFSAYEEPPSKVSLSYRDVERGGKITQVLLLKYHRVMSGGPYDKGGWCGYYTLLKTEEEPYFDASKYKYLTLWVKGEKGTEDFVVSMSDLYLDKKRQSRQSKPIGEYLKKGKITRDWQKARIPLDEFYLDLKKAVSIAIDFERELFANGSNKGTVYINNIVFEK